MAPHVQKKADSDILTSSYAISKCMQAYQRAPLAKLQDWRSKALPPSLYSVMKARIWGSSQDLDALHIGSKPSRRLAAAGAPSAAQCSLPLATFRNLWPPEVETGIQNVNRGRVPRNPKPLKWPKTGSRNATLEQLPAEPLLRLRGLGARTLQLCSSHGPRLHT